MDLRIRNNLSSHRADEPAIKHCVAAMTDHNMIDSVPFRISHYLLGRMADALS
jgi:hypothetical protein